MTVRVKKALAFLAAAAGSMALLYWSVAFSVIDWLRFSSPLSPNEATGQIIFMKASKGVFYITSGQHFWLITVTMAAWMIGAASAAGLALLRPASVTWTPLAKSSGACLFGSVWLLSVISFGFGDHLIAFATTGSFALPPGHRPDMTSASGKWTTPVWAVIMLTVVGLSVWSDWKKRARQTSKMKGDTTAF